MKMPLYPAVETDYTFPMNIGFVINGLPEHGIVRASRFLSDEAGRVDGVQVAVLTSPAEMPGDAEFAQFQSGLADDAVLVFHASHRTNHIWGPHDRRIAHIVHRLQSANKPVVLYLHDIYGEGFLKVVSDKIKRKLNRKSLEKQGSTASPATQARKSLWEKLRSYEENFMRAIDPFVARYIVSNEIERGRLTKFVAADKISVLPHFIETRVLPCDTVEAKARLGMANKKIMTLLGFIVDRKGHDDAIAIAASLPENVQLVFAGKCDNSDYLAHLQKSAQDKGVQDRLTITGYLDEDALNLYMVATDVAICPFKDVSASGSLATWLSANKPIVAYDLPLLKEYARKFPDHITLARKDSTGDFAKTVSSVLEKTGPALSNKNIQDYSVENSARRFVEILKTVKRV